MADFSVCALLYGDDRYRLFHRRCLDSLAFLNCDRCEFRIALNSVTCYETRQQIDHISRHPDIHLQVIDGDNEPKYHRMRQLFDMSPLASAVMWFDDDSYLDQSVIGDKQEWLIKIQDQLIDSGMLGSIYRMRWRPGQRDWVTRQPWYQNRPLPDTPEFITGGWWTVRKTVLDSVGWPWPELSHNGGDFMLGVCLQQYGIPFRMFRHGVHINADHLGVESGAARRGLNERPIGNI